jgi:Ca2+-dependent lipid-binding protein
MIDNPSLRVLPSSSSSSSSSHSLIIHVKEAKQLQPVDFNGLSDPYCVINVLGEEFKTKIKKKNLNPVWDETFSISPVSPDVKGEIEVTLFDYDRIGKHTCLGQILISIEDIKKRHNIDEWFKLESRKHKKDKVKGEVHLQLEFTYTQRKTSSSMFEPIFFFVYVYINQKKIPI